MLFKDPSFTSIGWYIEVEVHYIPIDHHAVHERKKENNLVEEEETKSREKFKAEWTSCVKTNGDRVC